MSLSLATRRSVLAMGRRMTARRFESTATNKATETAKETASKASEYAGKAAQGLSRVTSAAGPAIVGAAKGVTGALGRVGGPTGRLVAFVERQTPFVLYWSRVGIELSKLVFKGQKMSPPPLSTFQTFFQNLWKRVQNPSALFQGAQNAANSSASYLQQIRNISNGQLVAGGVVLAECLGFFTVGEMIGRFKLIGYHGETHAHH